MFEKYGIHATVEDLIKQSNTRLGMTTLYDMKRTALEWDLHVEGVKTDFDSLTQLIEDYDVICHFTENAHYIWVQSIDDKEVHFIDPSWVSMDGGAQTMWRHVFEQEWKGVCLVVSDQPLDLEKYLHNSQP